MNLNHLAVFHAVAEEGSVSKGARRLLVSQPAVSKQLRALEASLGAALFHRLPRGMRLTEAGTLLAGYARRLFAIADEAEHALGELGGLRRGRLSVGASTTIGVYLLPEVFVRFRQTYPDVQLHLEIANSDAIGNRLTDGAIDVGLTERRIESDRFASTVFMEDQLVAIAPARHALARRRSVTAQALCRHPFVVRETGPGTKSLAQRVLAERGWSVRPAMSLGSTEAIKRAVAAGVGVAIVSRLTIALELRARQLAMVRLSDLSIRRPLHWVTLRGSQESPTLRAFKQFLNAATRSAGPSLPAPRSPSR